MRGQISELEGEIRAARAAEQELQEKVLKALHEVRERDAEMRESQAALELQRAKTEREQDERQRAQHAVSTLSHALQEREAELAQKDSALASVREAHAQHEVKVRHVLTSVRAAWRRDMAGLVGGLEELQMQVDSLSAAVAAQAALVERDMRRQQEDSDRLAGLVWAREREVHDLRELRQEQQEQVVRGRLVAEELRARILAQETECNERERVRAGEQEEHARAVSLFARQIGQMADDKARLDTRVQELEMQLEHKAAVAAEQTRAAAAAAATAAEREAAHEAACARERDDKAQVQARLHDAEEEIARLRGELVRLEESAARKSALNETEWKLFAETAIQEAAQPMRKELKRLQEEVQKQQGLLEKQQSSQRSEQAALLRQLTAMEQAADDKAAAHQATKEALHRAEDELQQAHRAAQQAEADLHSERAALIAVLPSRRRAVLSHFSRVVDAATSPAWERACGEQLVREISSLAAAEEEAATTLAEMQTEHTTALQVLEKELQESHAAAEKAQLLVSVCGACICGECTGQCQCMWRVHALCVGMRRRHHTHACTSKRTLTRTQERERERMQKREHATLHTVADQIECDVGLLYAQVDRTKQRVFEKARAALQQQCARAERAERTARAATCAGDAAVQAVLERVASEKAAAMADEAEARAAVEERERAGAREREELERRMRERDVEMRAQEKQVRGLQEEVRRLQDECGLVNKARDQALAELLKAVAQKERKEREIEIGQTRLQEVVSKLVDAERERVSLSLALDRVNEMPSREGAGEGGSAGEALVRPLKEDIERLQVSCLT